MGHQWCYLFGGTNRQNTYTDVNKIIISDPANIVKLFIRSRDNVEKRVERQGTVEFASSHILWTVTENQA